MINALALLLRKFLQSDYLTLIMCLALVIICAPTTPGFVSSQNAVNVLHVAAPLMLLAIGQTVVMLCGGIDLSITAIAAVSSVCGAWIMSDQKHLLSDTSLATPIALLTMPLVGAVIGLGNGLNVSLLRMPPFIATLTSMMFLYGFAVWLTQSNVIAELPESFIWVGNSNFAVFGVTMLLASTTAWVLIRSKYGRWVYAVGQSEATARVSGVPTQLTTALTYVVCGFMAGAASIFLTAQIESGSPVLAENQLLDVIGAVVIGGTSLFGGRGKVQWTAGGVLFISLLDNVLNLQSFAYHSIMIVKGALIILAAAIDSLRQHWGDE